MKKFMKLCIGILTICAFMFLEVEAAYAKEKNSEKPWFISDNSFDGVEYADPATYDTEEVYGKEWAKANKVVSNQGTPAEKSWFNSFNKSSFFFNPFFIILIIACIAMVFRALEIRKNHIINKEKNALEERRIALEEERYRNGDVTSKPYEKPIADSVNEDEANSIPVGNMESNGLAASIMTNTSTSSIPGDMNGDGIVDAKDSGFNIPNFM